MFYLFLIAVYINEETKTSPFISLKRKKAKKFLRNSWATSFSTVHLVGACYLSSICRFDDSLRQQDGVPKMNQCAPPPSQF